MIDGIAFLWTGVVIFLPGLAFVLPLARTLPKTPLHRVVVLAAGAGLALNAAILLLLNTFGIPFTTVSLVASYVAVGATGIVLFLWPLNQDRSHGVRPRWEDLPWAFLLAALFALVVYLRWLPFSGLSTPPGVDPVHHVAIVDLILGHRGLPPNYQPYWPLEGFTYHFGFHANAAALSLLSGLRPHESVLLLGPFLLGVSALAVYLFFATLTESEEAGVVAALAAGVLSVFPSFYLIWGRLPQLAGVVLVLVTLSLFLKLPLEKGDSRLLLLTGFLVAGLLMTHYRMFLFFLFGLLALLLTRLAQEKRLGVLRRHARRFAPVFLVALVVALPWVWTLSGSFLAENLLSRPLAGNPEVFSLERVSRPLSFPSTFWLASLSVLGGVATALWRRYDFLLLASWAGLSWFLSNSVSLPLAIAGLLDFITWISVSFVFQAGFVGLGLLVVLRSLRERSLLYHGTLASVAAAILLLGILGTVVVPTDTEILVTADDQRAFAWIRENLPEDAVFATNVGVFEHTKIVGPTDAGAWITYFTGRKQLAPAPISILEQPLFPEYREQIASLPSYERRVDGFDSFLHLRSLGASHLYLGGRQVGPMGPEGVGASPWYDVVYDEGNVTIAEFVDIDAMNPLTLRGGQDWSELENGRSVPQDWEPYGLVLESFSFEGFRVTYPIYLATTGSYRLSVHLADFVAEDWVTGEPLSGVVFEMNGQVLLEYEYGRDAITRVTMDIPFKGPGVHTLTIRDRDPDLPFRISLGSIEIRRLA